MYLCAYIKESKVTQIQDGSMLSHWGKPISTSGRYKSKIGLLVGFLESSAENAEGSLGAVIDHRG